MPAKIKFDLFNALFRLFSFLADKTNGWQVFVKPKLLFGSLVMGLSINTYSNDSTTTIVANCYDGNAEVIEIPMANDFPVEEDTTVYKNVELMPEFPGGMSEMNSFITKALRFPAVSCYEGRIQGRVVLSFIVEKDGTLSYIKVIRGLHSLLEKEAIRIIESMPKWIPGKQNGQPVRVQFFLPMNIDF